MSKDFEWPVRISSGSETLDAYMHEGVMKPEKVEVSDLYGVMEWIAMYETEDPSEEVAQGFVNVIGMLQAKIDQMEARAAMTAAKRRYAQEHGIPVSRVRVVRS